MEGISCSLFHFCDNHGPTVLFTTKVVRGGSETLSRFIKQFEVEKSRAYECFNCVSLAENTPYMISNTDKDEYVVSGRSLFQSNEEASKINHIGIKLCFKISILYYNV